MSYLASYLVELALVDASMLKHSYSITAAAAVHVAMRAVGKADAYPRALARHSGYSLQVMLPVAASLVDSMHKAPTATLTAVYKKYSSTKFSEVAKLPAPLAVMDDAAALNAE